MTPVLPGGMDLDSVLRKLEKRARPESAKAFQVLWDLRIDKFAMRAFPDLSKFLWLDLVEVREGLGSRRTSKRRWNHPGLRDLGRRKIIDFEFSKLSGRAALGYRFLLPPWDFSRDPGFCPKVGDVIETKLKKIPNREVVFVGESVVHWRFAGDDGVGTSSNKCRVDNWARWVENAERVIPVVEAVDAP